MRYARLQDNAVAEIIDLPAGLAIADAFHPDVASTMIEAPDPAVTVGWLWDGEALSPPTTDHAEHQRAMIAAVDARRDGILAGGYPTAGLHISLSNASRADMTAMAATALAAIGGAIPWPDSYALGWIAMENERLALATPVEGLTLAGLVGDYYARTVQHARTLKDAVLAAPDEAALDAIDISAGWPTVG
ncbi:Uncharacterised protein [Starkeya nomas]|uniref:DUF4376 domain-containing protein n=1 Tax=Starkeya nomas TaxID=2666134 RepID=A0A5S9NBC4_9HYPH|nr:hypothetical protein [Starkeya nomas]CAA0086845.1 Uncharacterised protein [Starkeya nomas]